MKFSLIEEPFIRLILCLTAAVIIFLGLIIYQGHVIRQQRDLIREIITDPSVLCGPPPVAAPVNRATPVPPLDPQSLDFAAAATAVL